MNNKYFMEKALELAEKALNMGEFPVGCVIEYNGEIVAAGSRTGTTGDFSNEIDHAEIIALKNFSTRNFSNTEKKKSTIFCTMEPCLMCYGAILLSNIGTIVYAYEDAMGGGTGCDLSTVAPLYQDCKININSGVCREKSLNLFKAFFNDKNNIYWEGSLLAEYTLNL